VHLELHVQDLTTQVPHLGLRVLELTPQYQVVEFDIARGLANCCPNETATGRFGQFFRGSPDEYRPFETSQG
jgi:hypothetical protein